MKAGGTADGVVVGTVGFMAPEQARGAGETVDQRADVYGLGGILFFLFTADNPVPDADPFALMRQAELAADVAAYRNGRAVSAYRETTLERAARFGRTHRTAILLVLAYMLMRAAVALLAGR